MDSAQAALKVAILIFDKVEELDFAGPYEVFGAANYTSEAAGRGQVIDLFTVAETNNSIKCIYGLSVSPDYSVDDCPQPDIVIVPGGTGARESVSNKAIVGWLEQSSAQARHVCSVCTGTFLLHAAGLITGRKVTTHWSRIETLREAAPECEVLEDVRFVDSGKIITAAGISAGIDMSLYLIQQLFGKERADTTARYMQYDYWNSSE